MKPKEIPGREPTAEQLLQMAYVDGCMGSAARRRFELRLEREEGLRREVFAEQLLHGLITRHAGLIDAPPASFARREPEF